MPLKLQGVLSDKITINDYTFEVKGLSRLKAYEYLKKVQEMKLQSGDNVNVDTVCELENWLVDQAISDEKGRQLVKDLPRNEFDQVINLIFKLSGLELTPESKNS